MQTDTNITDEPMIIIGGMSRSGTTMMHGLICNHPDTIPPTRECSYLRMLVDAFRLGQEWFPGHTLDYFDDEEDFLQFNREIADQYLSRVRARFGPGLIVQKEPSFTPLFGPAGQLLPAARFVVMVRDPRDVVASQMRRAKKSGGTPDPNATFQRYGETYEKLMQDADELDGRLKLVRYEDLVHDPEAVMTDVFDFVQLGLEEIDLGSLVSSWQLAGKPEKEAATPLLGRPPIAEMIGRYEDVLPPHLSDAMLKYRTQLTSVIGFDPFWSAP